MGEICDTKKSLWSEIATDTKNILAGDDATAKCARIIQYAIRYAQIVAFCKGGRSPADGERKPDEGDEDR